MGYGIEFVRYTASTVRRLQAYAVMPLAKVMGVPWFAHHVGVLTEATVPSLQRFREMQILRLLDRWLAARDHPMNDIIRVDMSKQRAGTYKDLAEYKRPWIEEAIRIKELWHEEHKEIAVLCPEMSNDARLAIAPRRLPDNKVEFEKAALPMLALSLSFKDWKQDPDHPTTAPLVQIKKAPAYSFYLRMESRKQSARRARLRLNRPFTQHSRNRFASKDEVIDPKCVHHACQQQDPVPVETVEHMSMHCPAYDLARQRLVAKLKEDQLIDRVHGRLTFALALGHLQPPVMLSRPSSTWFALLNKLLTATNVFYDEIIHIRDAIPDLMSFGVREDAPANLRWVRQRNNAPAVGPVAAQAVGQRAVRAP